MHTKEGADYESIHEKLKKHQNNLLDTPLRKREIVPKKSESKKPKPLETGIDIEEKNVNKPHCNSVRKSIIKKRNLISEGLETFGRGFGYALIFFNVFLNKTNLKNRFKQNKSDKKRRYLATCKIDLIPTHRRHRSITLSKPFNSPRDMTSKTYTEDEVESDPDYCDEYEESLGDSAEYRGRHSIAEMVTMHKLNTTKTILKADKVRVPKKLNIEKAKSTRAVIHKKEKKVADVFEWCDEFDDIINDCHPDFNTKNHPFSNVVDYSGLFKEDDFSNKYDYLSSFMSYKADKIRNADCEVNKEQTLASKAPLKRKQTSRCKVRNSVVSGKTHHKMMKSVSYNPEQILNVTSLIGKNQSFKSKDKKAFKSFLKEDQEKLGSHLIGYIDSLGMFRLNLDKDTMHYLPTDLTENIGFFDKLSFDGSLKEWQNGMREAFLVHKDIFEEAIFSTSKPEGRFLLWKAILNWSYFDNIPQYIVDEGDLTCYNNPILK